ncbi:LemA family protein [Methylocystis sp. JR02]|uniref:LemA family protein n=1 Tax=Methylocystis sp. JR02 TaxID=3046284 RepID=UPI0024BBC902|nr:LemA family protein [Methylocystis sp. JR02]MDJ0449407.1 LemA family protein [Methylocystis sp. JR02]
MAPFLIAFICLCIAAAVLASRFLRLQSLDAQCKAAAEQVDAELANWHAMLPALAGVMRAFAPKERGAVDVVARLHASGRRAGSPQARLLAEARLGDGVHGLLARAQATPEIQRLDDFRQLRAALEEAEGGLAAARRRLATATADYNRALRRFPECLFAGRLRLTPRDYYDIAVDDSRAGETLV